MVEGGLVSGVERKGDVVEMGSYGGVLGEVEGWEWGGELMWFEKVGCVGRWRWYVE